MRDDRPTDDQITAALRKLSEEHETATKRLSADIQQLTQQVAALTKKVNQQPREQHPHPIPPPRTPVFIPDESPVDLVEGRRRIAEAKQVLQPKLNEGGG